jgi:hypothetical protein
MCSAGGAGGAGDTNEEGTSMANDPPQAAYLLELRPPGADSSRNVYQVSRVFTTVVAAARAAGYGPAMVVAGMASAMIHPIAELPAAAFAEALEELLAAIREDSTRLAAQQHASAPPKSVM